jgi:hypothetical protein
VLKLDLDGKDAIVILYRSSGGPAIDTAGFIDRQILD